MFLNKTAGWCGYACVWPLRHATQAACAASERRPRPLTLSHRRARLLSDMLLYISSLKPRPMAWLFIFYTQRNRSTSHLAQCCLGLDVLATVEARHAFIFVRKKDSPRDERVCHTKPRPRPRARWQGGGWIKGGDWWMLRTMGGGTGKEASRGFEPRSLDSESRVLAVTPRSHCFLTALLHSIWCS